jgi:hypothetical protein
VCGSLLSAASSFFRRNCAPKRGNFRRATRWPSGRRAK